MSHDNRIITADDLEHFRIRLLEDITKLLQTRPETHKEWLNAMEVRKLLGISDGKLQQLRINGLLYSSKAGAVHYYRYESQKRL